MKFVRLLASLFPLLLVGKLVIGQTKRKRNKTLLIGGQNMINKTVRVIFYTMFF